MDGAEESNSSQGKCETHLQQQLDLYKQLMSNGSYSDRVKASMKLSKDYCSHLPRDILSSIIPILGECLRADPSTGPQMALQVAAVHCLKCMAANTDPTVGNEIGRSGAIRHMVRLLSVESDETFCLVIVKCLWVLVSFGDECRVVLARSNGLWLVFQILGNRGLDHRLEMYMLEILTALAMLKHVRKELTQFGRPRHLIQATSIGSVASRRRACLAIGFLAISKSMRRVLAVLGAIPALIEVYQTGDIHMKLVAANALGLISARSNVIRQAARAGVVGVFSELLLGPGPVGREIAVDAFCMLSVAESNAIDIADHMVRVLKNGRDEAKASAADVLWDIATYRHTAPVVQNSGAIPILMELLRAGCKPVVKERVCVLVGRLCYEKRGRDAIVDVGGIELLAAIMDGADESEENVKQIAAEALFFFYEDPDYGVRVSEAIDVASLINKEDLVAEIRRAGVLMSRSLRRMNGLVRHPGFI